MAKTADFIAKHPRCCHCGGKNLAVTRDHVPPRALFNSRVWPEGYEFPACAECNLGSNLVDQLAGLISRLSVADEEFNEGEFAAFLQAINNNQPDAHPNFITSSIEARRILRELRIPKPPGRFAEDICEELTMVTVSADVFQRLDPLFRRMYCALHYMHVGTIVPAGTRVLRVCTTNQILSAPDPLSWQRLPGVQNEVTLKRGNRDLRQQFDYKWGLLTDGTFGVTFHMRKAIFGAMAGPLTQERVLTHEARDVLTV